MNLLAYDISKCHEVEEEGRACKSGKNALARGRAWAPRSHQCAHTMWVMANCGIVPRHGDGVRQEPVCLVG